jgi:hypothetical protein
MIYFWMKRFMFNEITNVYKTEKLFSLLTLSDWCVMAYKSQQPKTSEFPMGTILSVSDGPLASGKGTPYVYVNEREEAVHDTHVSVM